MTFKREYIALISAAWDIDRAYDKYLTDYDNDTNPLVKLGLIGESDEKSQETRKELLKRLMKLDPDNNFRKRMVGDGTEKDIDMMSMCM
jgi:hypothetical protein